LNLLLADLIVAVHLAFIIFVVAGGLLALRRPRAAWLHLPAVIWGAVIEFTGAACPLTPLENMLRAAAGSERYAGDFVGRYLLQVVYPDGLTRESQVALGAAVLALNAAIYAWMLVRRRRRG
jgi:hypothetical protein